MILSRKVEWGPLHHCIFCDQTDLTDEHIWGRRMRKHLPTVNGKTTHVVTAINGPNYNETLGHLHGNRNSIDHTVRVVCEKCNNGWMSRLQNKTSRNWIKLATGQWPTMSKNEWTDIIRLIVLTTMVVEWADQNTVTFTQAERENFRTTLDIPLGLFVLASGYHDFKETGIAFNHFSLFVSAPPCLFPMQTTCFVVGQLLIYVMSSTFDLTNEAIEMEAKFKLRRLHPRGDIPAHPPFTVGYLHFDEISAFLAKKHGGRVHSYRQKDWPEANWSLQ